MRCSRCHSDRVVHISAWARDCFVVDYPDGKQHDGYFPSDLGHLGCEDEMAINVCLHCGTIQGKFPIEVEDEADD